VLSDLVERLLQFIVPPNNLRVVPGNDKFRRGDRVVVHADPHQFKQMQPERYGGWNDDMALVSCNVYNVLQLRDIRNCTLTLLE